MYRLYSSLSDVIHRPCYAEIDLSALRRNYRVLSKKAKEKNPNCRPIAVVKADAYGHGAPACVRALHGEGCTFFAVSCVEEGISVRNTLRELGATGDILILGYTPPESVQALISYELTPTLISFEHANAFLRALGNTPHRLSVHVKLDTGMNRVGFATDTSEARQSTAWQIEALSKEPHLKLAGMFSHYARADEPTDASALQYTQQQADRFAALVSLLKRADVPLPFCHLSNTAATLLGLEPCFDGVRLGIALYGMSPLAQQFGLHPVMRLVTRIVHLHTLTLGDGVGYGSRFTADTPRLIATLPIGYADGWLRAYTGAYVCVHTEHGDFEAPIVGNVCMDQCMLDVTDLPVSLGDHVTLFGDTPARLSALCRRASTISYEALCLISARVPRVFKQ